MSTLWALDVLLEMCCFWFLSESACERILLNCSLACLEVDRNLDPVQLFSSPVRRFSMSLKPLRCSFWSQSTCSSSRRVLGTLWRFPLRGL